MKNTFKCDRCDAENELGDEWCSNCKAHFLYEKDQDLETRQIEWNIEIDPFSDPWTPPPPEKEDEE